MNEENKKEVLDDISKFKSIVSLKNLDSGKLLISSLEKEVAGGIERIVANYKTMGHIELVANISKIEANLTLLKVMKYADKNLEMAQEEYTNLLTKV